jgi:hypothetical protein
MWFNDWAINPIASIAFLPCGEIEIFTKVRWDDVRSPVFFLALSDESRKLVLRNG